MLRELLAYRSLVSVMADLRDWFFHVPSPPAATMGWVSRFRGDAGMLARFTEETYWAGTRDGTWFGLSLGLALAFILALFVLKLSIIRGLFHAARSIV
jgi:hypothetical protein